ncbi:MAG TPA: autotransporter outer membrane beta-barrel domain-containing protein [Malonomonas sp.]
MILIMVVFLGLTPLSGEVAALTLDEAVSRQLEVGPVLGLPCEELLGIPRDLSSLVGALNTNICGRAAPVGGTFPSQSAGGGAATPPTVSGLVQLRADAAREKGDGKSDPVNVTVELGKRYGLFLSSDFETLDRDVTTYEGGYDSSVWRLTIGSDAMITDRLTLGIAFDMSRQAGDFFGGGNFDIDSYGVVGFGIYLPTEESFVQFYGGYTLQSHERRRLTAITEIEESSGTITFRTSGQARTEYDADQYSAGVQTGYDFLFGGFSIGPRVGLDWVHSKYDTYSEADSSGLGLTFYNDEKKSLQSSVGLLGTVNASTDFGVVTMQQSVTWKHEFDQDQRNVEVSFVDDTLARRFRYQTEKPDRDFYEFNAGLSLILPNGIQPYVNYRALFGHSYIENYAGTIGIRVEL